MAVFKVVLLLCFAYRCSLGLNITNSMEYLRTYGYIPSESNEIGKLVSEDTIKNGLSRFQKNMGLPVTGLFDEKTEKMMSKPRCGISDLDGPQAFSVVTKWEKTHLTYRILEYSRKLSRNFVDQEIARAFAIWSLHTPLTFSKTDRTSDIEIKFTTTGTYQNPFDGPGGKLAYAFYPQNGDAYFDDSEDWKVGNRGSTDLFIVAVHEFGHSLGLAHSSVYQAVMFPVYQEVLNLHIDDIRGIQTLYGKPRTYPSYTTSPPATTKSYWNPRQDYPNNNPRYPNHNPSYPGHNHPNFHPDYPNQHPNQHPSYPNHRPDYPHHHPNQHPIYPHYPNQHPSYPHHHPHRPYLPQKSTDSPQATTKPTPKPATKKPENPKHESKNPVANNPDNNKPPNLCKNPNFDAILVTAEKDTFIFKNDFFYKLDNLGLGKPKKIKDVWRELPSNLDAAFAFEGNNYYLKGRIVWSYKYDRLNPGYPKLISQVFPSVPDDVDAAATIADSPSTIYFYKDNNIYTHTKGVTKLLTSNSIIGKVDAVFQDKFSNIYYFKDKTFKLAQNLKANLCTALHFLKCKGGVKRSKDNPTQRTKNNGNKHRNDPSKKRKNTNKISNKTNNKAERKTGNAKNKSNSKTNKKTTKQNKKTSTKIQKPNKKQNNKKNENRKGSHKRG